MRGKWNFEHPLEKHHVILFISLLISAKKEKKSLIFGISFLRFFVILETLVGFALSGPTSALAFSESVLCVIDQSAGQVGNKEHLWRMWSIVVHPLTEWINQVIH